MFINMETKLQTENILSLTVAKFDMVPYFVISVRDVPGEVPTSIPTQDKVAATRQDIYQEQLAQACVVFFFFQKLWIVLIYGCIYACRIIFFCFFPLRYTDFTPAAGQVKRCSKTDILFLVQS